MLFNKKNNLDLYTLFSLITFMAFISPEYFHVFLNKKTTAEFPGANTTFMAFQKVFK